MNKQSLNDGIDLVGNFAIDLLPANGFIKTGLKETLDLGTDLIFDPKKNVPVALSEHSEIHDLAERLVPVILGLMKSKVLAPLDIPFVEGENETLFEEGLLLQIKALLLQAIEDAFKSP